jgi:hypothetical protein
MVTDVTFDASLLKDERGIDFLKLCKGIGAIWVVAEGFHLDNVK